jgi:FHA domain
LHTKISVINYALDLSSTDKDSKYTAFLSNAIFNLLQSADAESQRIDACTVALVRTNLKNRISLSGLDKSLCTSIFTQLPHLFGKHAGIDAHPKCVTASWTREGKDETPSTPTSSEKWLLIKCGNLQRLIRQVDCPFTIGRTAETDLLIESLVVSRVHARILFDGEQFVLNDTSTNGSLLRLNGGPLVRLSRSSAELGNSGVIQFADTTKQGQKGSIISLYYQTISLSRR